MVDLRGALVLGVVDRLADRGDDTVQQVAGQLAELGPREPDVEVLGTGRIGCDKRNA